MSGEGQAGLNCSVTLALTTSGSSCRPLLWGGSGPAPLRLWGGCPLGAAWAWRSLTEFVLQPGPLTGWCGRGAVEAVAGFSVLNMVTLVSGIGNEGAS